MSTKKPLMDAEVHLESLGLRILNEVLDAHVSRDYSKMAALLNEPARRGLSEQVFHQAIDNQLQKLGASTEIIFLGSLMKSDSTLTVWKVRYEKSNQEILWQLFLTNGSDVKVAGVTFS